MAVELNPNMAGVVSSMISTGYGDYLTAIIGIS